MENIDLEIEEAQKKLEELKRRKLELPTVVKIHTFIKSVGKIRITLSKPDEFCVDVLRRVPSRVYNGADNILNGTDLDNVLKMFEAREKDNLLKIEWASGVKESYENWIKQPDVYLSLDEKRSTINISLGPKMINQRLYMASDLSTLSYNQEARSYTLALAEAYKFPQLVEKYHPSLNVEYQDELKLIIEEQAKKVEQLLMISSALDCPDMANPFTGLDENGNRYDLKPVQRVAVKFSELANDNAIIAYDMGGGKTPISFAIKELRGYKKALAVVPAKAKTHWASEFKKFTGKSARILSGETPDEFAIDDVIDNKYELYIINYDILSRASMEEEDAKGKGTVYENKWAMLINLAKFDIIFVDECHRIKNMGSLRSKAVRALQAPHFVPLSGTLIVNRPKELFPNLHLVNRTDFNNEPAFTNNFMYGDGTPKNIKKLHEILSHYMIRRNWEQIHGKNLDPVRIPYKKELSDQARVNYQKVLAGVYIALRRPDYQRNVTSILAELTRCKQICSADNVDTTIDLAVEAFEETEKKVIIFSQYLDSLAGIQEGLGKSCVVINGSTPDDVRDEYTKKFQTKMNKEVTFIATNITEIFTWTEAHTVIFNDLWWTDKDHSQAEGRAFGRVNDPHSGNSYWLINELTIDGFIYELIQKKRAIFKEVIDGVNVAQESQKSVVSELIEHLRENL